MTASTWACAPESSTIARIRSTSPGESAGAEGGVELGRRGRRSSVEGEGDEHGALALDQVIAGGLAGDDGVAEDAEQVVAELEGLAEREAERRSSARVWSEAPARAAPIWMGRSMEYFADL